MKFSVFYLMEKNGWTMKKTNGVTNYSMTNKDNQILSIDFDNLGMITGRIFDGKDKIVVYQEFWDGKDMSVFKTAIQKIVILANKNKTVNSKFEVNK